MATEQPQVMNNQGVVLTVGILAASERTAIVLPMFTESTTLDDINRCTDAVNSFVTSALPGLLDLLCTDGGCSFVQGEGMVDGTVPYRTDFASDEQVGTQTPPALTGNTSALAVFYCDPADVGPSGRMTVAKNFIPGLPVSNVTLDRLNDFAISAVADWANSLVAGYASVIDSGSKWYRGLKAPFVIVGGKKTRPRSTPIQRTILAECRGYLSTQRRRFVPH